MNMNSHAVYTYVHAHPQSLLCSPARLCKCDSADGDCRLGSGKINTL